MGRQRDIKDETGDERGNVKETSCGAILNWSLHQPRRPLLCGGDVLELFQEQTQEEEWRRSLSQLLMLISRS